MKTLILALAHWFSRKLNSLASALENTGAPDRSSSKFVDLAPTDEADKNGIYSGAILFATNNPKVANIALTGPYGSGKSSIIQTFLKRYQRPALHISLAAFVPEQTPNVKKSTSKEDIEEENRQEEVHRQEIERSILQQMLYGADANKLPLSRFKRIQTPGFWSVFKSLFILNGALSVWYVFSRRETIIDGSFFTPFALENWLNLGGLVISVLFLWVAVHHLYVASFGLSLKSISLKDIEIKPASDDQ